MKKAIFLLFVILSPIGFLSAQNTDLNEFYRYPVSISAGYGSFSPLRSDTGIESTRSIYSDIRVPLPGYLTIQPTARLAYTLTDVNDPVFPLRWDHNQGEFLLGVSWVNRFSKDFELGVLGVLGFGQSVFPEIEDGTYGTGYFIANLEAILGLTPAYNLAIDVRPALKFQQALSAFDDFNGFSAGVSFTAHYRFGDDPNASQNLFRSIRFNNLKFSTAFSAMQSYYVKNPMGFINIENTENRPLKNITVSFFQNGYMDSPTILLEMDELPPETNYEVPIKAAFNDEVFFIEGIKPLTGQLVVEYTVRGRTGRQEYPVTYDLYDKHSITWDNDEKAAAFITKDDSAVRNYATFLRQSISDTELELYNSHFQTAMQLYNGLPEIGCIYQSDPVAPFITVQNDTFIIDSINLPRETLKRGAGDCDDLTVLYASLLESLGISSGFITTPGHIYAAFNTEVQAKNYRELNIDRDMTINIDGELWVPVEITLIGKAGFLEAWRRGADEWNQYADNPEKRSFYVTRTAQEKYRPVGLRETDLGLHYGNKSSLQKIFADTLAEHKTAQINALSKWAENDSRKLNEYGIILSKYGQLTQARRVFEQAAGLDKEYLSPLVNMANIAYLTKDYNLALRNYYRVEEILVNKNLYTSPLAQKIFINLSQTLYALRDYDTSREYFVKASDIDPQGVSGYSYLSSENTGRASEASDEILFAEEE